MHLVEDSAIGYAVIHDCRLIRRVGKRWSRMNLIVGNVESLPVPDGSQDAVTFFCPTNYRRRCDASLFANVRAGVWSPANAVYEEELCPLTARSEIPI